MLVEIHGGRGHGPRCNLDLGGGSGEDRRRNCRNF